MSAAAGRTSPVRILGAVSALALVLATLWIGGTGQVFSLLTSVTPRALLLAMAAAFGSMVMRGFRLSFLLPAGVLSPLRALPVAAAAQAAALFVPARLGELAMPYLLRRDAGLDTATGVATLFAARALDTAALGAWAAAAIVLRHGFTSPLALGVSFALIALPVLVTLLVAVTDDAVRRRHPAGDGWAEKWADRLHRVRLGLDESRRHPTRLWCAGMACLASWAFQWILTWWLLAAMGFRWPVWDVVTGSVVASLSNLLPINLIANLGTLEAGWTAAFSAMGFPIETAAATGLAAHLWALVFSALFGAVAWLFLRNQTA